MMHAIVCSGHVEQTTLLGLCVSYVEGKIEETGDCLRVDVFMKCKADVR